MNSNTIENFTFHEKDSFHQPATNLLFLSFDQIFRLFFNNYVLSNYYVYESILLFVFVNFN